MSFSLDVGVPVVQRAPCHFTIVHGLLLHVVLATTFNVAWTSPMSIPLQYTLHFLQNVIIPFGYIMVDIRIVI